MSARIKYLLLSIGLPVFMLAVMFFGSAKSADAAFWYGWGYAIQGDFTGSNAEVHLVLNLIDNNDVEYFKNVKLGCKVSDGASISGGLFLNGESYVYCRVPALRDELVLFSAEMGNEWDSIQLNDDLGGRPYYVESTIFAEETGSWQSVIQGLNGDVDFRMLAKEDLGYMQFGMDSIELPTSDSFPMYELNTVGALIEQTPCNDANHCTFMYHAHGGIVGATDVVGGDFSPSNWENGGEIVIGEGVQGMMTNVVWDPYCTSPTNPGCN